MPSSISNSDRTISFPLRVGLGTCVLVLLYGAFIAAIRPDWTVSYDAGTRNRAVAERFIDGWHGDAVLVGSSIAFILSKEFMRTDDLGPNIYNLGLSGGHAATGLDIIIRKREWPRRVFVEMNVMDRGYDLEFARRRFSEPWRTVRTIVPAMRLEYRPFDLAIVALWKLLRGARGSEITTERAFTPNPTHSTDEQQIDGSYRAQIDASLKTIQEQIAVLRDHDVRIVLVRFPAHPAIEADPRTRYLWQKIYDAFPPKQYEWLEPGKDESFEIPDGIHLSIPSARRFAAILRKFAEDNDRR